MRIIVLLHTQISVAATTVANDERYDEHFNEDEEQKQ